MSNQGPSEAFTDAIDHGLKSVAGSLRDEKDELREKMLQAVQERRGCGRDEAEVVIKRIASRLDGYSHAEVEQMHPLPSPSEDVD